MKISNSAALFLASSAALAATTAVSNVDAFAPVAAVRPFKTAAGAAAAPSPTARFVSDADDGEDGGGGDEKNADGGNKKELISDQEMQLKRMNFDFNRGRSAAGGGDGGGGGDVDEVPSFNPLRDIQSYIPVAEPVAIRDGLKGGTCLVSGARATPELFYLLNSEDSAFGFGEIVSVSEDVPKTKKRLLTRTARYTGLLSKLAHEEGKVVPPSSALDGASSWIALVDTVQDLQALIPSSSKVDNLSVLFFYPADAELQLGQLSDDLMAVNPDASLVLVPQAELEEETDEDSLVGGGADESSRPVPIMYYYQQGSGEPVRPAARELGAVPAGSEAEDGAAEEEVPPEVLLEPKLVRDPAFLEAEANRLAVECLQLKAGKGKTLRVQCLEKKSAIDLMQLVKQEEPLPPNVFARLVLGLREAGYERSQEMAYVMNEGADRLRSKIAKFHEANPDAAKRMAEGGGGSITGDGDGDDEIVTTTNVWWEDPEFQELVKESSLRKEEMEQLEAGSSSS